MTFFVWRLYLFHLIQSHILLVQNIYSTAQNTEYSTTNTNVRELYEIAKSMSILLSSFSSIDLIDRAPRVSESILAP